MYALARIREASADILLKAVPNNTILRSEEMVDQMIMLSSGPCKLSTYDEALLRASSPPSPVAAPSRIPSWLTRTHPPSRGRYRSDSLSFFDSYGTHTDLGDTNTTSRKVSQITLYRNGTGIM